MTTLQILTLWLNGMVEQSRAPICNVTMPWFSDHSSLLGGSDFEIKLNTDSSLPCMNAQTSLLEAL